MLGRSPAVAYRLAGGLGGGVRRGRKRAAGGGPPAG